MTGSLIRFCCFAVVLVTALHFHPRAWAEQEQDGSVSRPQNAADDSAGPSDQPQPPADATPQREQTQSDEQPRPAAAVQQPPSGSQPASTQSRFAGPGSRQPRSGNAADSAAANAAARNGAAAAASGDRDLVLNFSGADWRVVLDWLAERADLSLQVDRYPPGTANYSDNTRTYSVAEAMDVLNRLLLDKGFALIRRDRSLMLIDLQVDNARDLISEIAELVTPDELDSRGDSDIVRCVFSLGGLSPDAARTEIGLLRSPAGSVIVLDSARQVVVTDTVNRLKAVRTLLANATTASSDVTEIVLKHRVADELLEIARPLIGLEPGVNFNDKIRIAIGLYGDRLYATGDPSTRALLQGIVERADTPLQTSPVDGNVEQSMPRLETYSISTADSATVMDVLQSQLAGFPDTRLTVDPQTGGIIALARPETHQLIQQIVDKLEGRGSTFEIIQLRRLEPSQALLTINKFFGVTEPGRKDVPTVDGDPATGRLWVRGTPEQVELVKGLIERLEGADASGPLGNRVRVLPYTGRSAEETVEQLQNIWDVIGRKNRIRMVSPAGGGAASSSSSFPQRRVGGLAPTPLGGAAEEMSQPREFPASTPEPDRRDERFERGQRDSLPPQEAQHHLPNNGSQLNIEPTTLVSDTPARPGNTSPAASDIQLDASPFAKQNNPVAEQPDPETDPQAAPDGSGDIVITLTPGGMIVASEDPIALSDFEQMMRTLSDQSALSSAQPTVFWLKYAKAPEAADLVTRILGGGDSGGGGGLASSMLGELGGGMLGGLLGLGGGGGDSGSGAILTTTGSVSIVADGRLNALIVQANAIDMLTIEMILEVVDREESPENVRTTSKPQLIPVIYQDAAEVATIVKAVYAERSGEQGASSRQQQQPQMTDIINAIRGGSGGSGSRGGRGGASEQTTKPAPVTIAVDARSNSLIVTAPPQDVDDIRELVEAIDAGGMQTEETVEIVSLKGNIKADVVQQALDSILGTKARSTSATAATPSASSGTPTSGGTAPSSDDIRRRIEFFQQMQRSGGSPSGGGAPGGGSTFGGGSPFGGGSFGGSSRGGSSSSPSRGSSSAPSSRGTSRSGR